MKTIFDIITGEIISFKQGELTPWCRNRGYKDATSFSHLFGGRQRHVDARYILPQDKHLIYPLFEWETKKPLPCLTVKTLFLHHGFQNFRPDYDDKYFYELINGRQKTATIGGVIITSDPSDKIYPKAATLTENPKLLNIRKENKINNKLKNRLRNRLAGYVKLFLTVPSFTAHAQKLVGCPVFELKSHIENQFSDGMSWDNWGKTHDSWQIDHIIPCATFDFSKEGEIEKCFHFSNLQPMWAKENWSKGCRL